MIKRKRTINDLQNSIQKTKDWTTRTPLRYQFMWVIWLCNVYYQWLFSECGSPWQEWWMYEGVSGNIYTNMVGLVWFMVFNATFNNISVKSWRTLIWIYFNYTNMNIINTIYGFTWLIEMVEVSFFNLWEWTMLYDWLAHVIVVHMVCPAYHNWLLPTVHKCMVMRIFVPCTCLI